MIEKSFFLENINKFYSLYKGEKATFINYDNTHFISMPLIKTTKIKPIPIKDFNHILFVIVDSRLLILRNQKRIFKDSYLYKLAFYSLFVNQQILKYLLLNTLKMTKNKYGIKASEFFNKIF
jgi:hypothetical protein